MADAPVLRPEGIPTIFGDLEAKSITFLVDTSGSMYPYLEVVKEHLVEVLLARSFKRNDSMFNIMEFSSEVVPWADCMVKCTPQTVTVAAEWVKNLGCKTGTNTLDALLAGFADRACEALYLVTDGLPDQTPEEILQHVALVSDGRPVHAIYLAGGIADLPACEFLTFLATETAGTFQTVRLSSKGSIEEVKVVVCSDHAPPQIPNPPPTTLDNPPMRNVKVYDVSAGNGIPATSIKTTLPNLPRSNTVTYVDQSDEMATKMCSVTTSVDHDPAEQRLISVDDIPTRVIRTENVQLRYPDLTWETYRPTAKLVRKLLANADSNSVTGGVLLQGMRVLARRDKDGFYCLGYVKQQVTANHTFLIEFDKEPRSKAQPQLQETAVYDIISYNDASRHSVAAGDKVLAPHGKLQFRYAPGSVLEGLEGRSSGCAADSEGLVVSFFDGKTEKISKHTSIWIPLKLYERIKLEIQMPITARQYLVNNPYYPVMLPPGYNSRTGVGTGYLSKTTAGAQETGYLMGGYEAVGKYPVYVPVYPDDSPAFGFRMPSVRESIVKSEEVHKLIPGTNLTKEDLNRKVMQQLMDHKMIPTMPEVPKASGETRQRVSPPQSGTLRKSVSFQKEEGEMDSGIGSCTAAPGVANELLSESESEDEEKDENVIETGTQTLSLRDSGVGTDYSLLYNYHPDTSLDERPPWRYWNPNSKSSRPSSHKNSKAKPFRDTVLSAPAEARAQPILAEPITAFSQAQDQALLDSIDQEIRTDRAQLEWIQRHPHPPLRPPYDPEVDMGPVNRSSAFNTVNHQIKSDRAHLEWIQKHPHPPNGATRQQVIPAHRKIGSRDMVREAKEKAYLEYRRNQVMQMEAHFSQMEMDARRVKEAKEQRCRASVAVEESLTMRYDTAQATQVTDTVTSDQIPESEIMYPDNMSHSTQPTTQSYKCITDGSQPLTKTREKLTVRDVVFGERKTLTPPPATKEEKEYVPHKSGKNDTHRGQIVFNPYILYHSFSTTPKTTFQVGGTGETEHGNVAAAQNDSSQCYGTKSLQAKSQLQRCTNQGEKNIVQVTKSTVDKMNNKDLENSVITLLSENYHPGTNPEELMQSMQQMLMKSSQVAKPIPPTRSVQSSKSTFHRFHQRSTVKTAQTSKELSSSSKVHNVAVTEISGAENQPNPQQLFTEKPITQFEGIQMQNHKNHGIIQNSVIHNSTTTQHSSSVTQKQSKVEKSVTQNSLGNSSGKAQTQAVLRAVENSSQVCAEVKSQMATETLTKMATSAIPKQLSHQRFAADVTRRDVQRQRDSEDKLRSIQEAKRSVSASIAKQQQERSNREAQREAGRVEALRQRSQRREEIAAQREKEIKDAITRRQEIKQQRQDELTRRHVQKLSEQSEQEALRDAQRRGNEIRRREFFYNKEQKNQEAKDLRLAVREQKQHDLRSQVLP
ncbi:uncharacterized protein LOC110991156 isoform X2 [Acanthaster planci]|uniref:Uncharacterized protein LOC110991156 isoform X2 n=1 Tax=Acanthaster planci TaxID=133434 RepID=A0A8B8A2W5_ACAPL|nr:uncharacterized protein LOC110991156 isoform X2 [Acanthaster planci]